MLECLHPCGLACFQDCKSSPCGVCVKIEKEKAKRELEREIKEISEKREQLEKEIKELSKQQGEDASCIELEPEGDSAAEYLDVKDRTEKFVQPQHGILPVVIRIEKIRSPRLQMKFLEAHSDLLNPVFPSRLLFHGTSNENIESIVQKGFRLPPPDKKNMFGQVIFQVVLQTK
eukprot:TRINITY_DN6763_c0_g1_i2.p3 TRINITY_DN6763_c0_g1~~TRINITY_DN6763_c0_g1_i2.p3  ORF type:complete len:174 (+),score=26.69 TRINITY_DN6763_c0_g1_i2:712-1233(+)